MATHMWRRVARWLLVLPVSAAALVVAYIGSQLLMLLGNELVRELDRLHLNLPIHGLLALQNVLEIFGICAMWFIPTAIAVAFAAQLRWRTALIWGVSATLALTAIYIWTTHPAGSSTVPHLVAIAGGLVLLLGSVLALRRPRRPRLHLFANVTVCGFLLIPSLVAIATAPRDLRAPKKLWSITLQKRTWDEMNTGNEFEATRHLVFAKDRLVTVYESASAPYQGKQPMSEYTLVSLDLKDGSVRNNRRFIGKWGFTPKLYATQDGNIVTANGSLIQLNADLTNTGRHFDLTRGLVDQMSPDGSTMAWETLPGVTLLDAVTLTVTSTHLTSSTPTSVSRAAILTDNIQWTRDYPHDRAFVTLIDSRGERLLFHSECGGRPAFLTNELVFVAGCGTIRMLDLKGHLMHEANVGGNVRFAGASQNGKRFAVVVDESRGDPSVVIFEHFILFDTETGRPIAMVRTEHMPAYQSWSAFSSDGALFATGDASELNLYQVP